MNTLSTKALSVTKLYGAQWGAAMMAAEHVAAAADALEALNIGDAKSELRAALDALPKDLGPYYDWPTSRAIHERYGN